QPGLHSAPPGGGDGAAEPGAAALAPRGQAASRRRRPDALVAGRRAEGSLDRGAAQGVEGVMVGHGRVFSLVPKLCLGTHLREPPVPGGGGNLGAVRETEFGGQRVPKQSLGTRTSKRGQDVAVSRYLTATPSGKTSPDPAATARATPCVRTSCAPP